MGKNMVLEETIIKTVAYTSDNLDLGTQMDLENGLITKVYTLDNLHLGKNLDLANCTYALKITIICIEDFLRII